MNKIKQTNMTQELKKGQEVTVSIPFTYTIGEVGFHTGKKLKTLEDCKNEVLAEIEAGVLEESDIFMDFN